jgi:hypothetical protein
MRYIVAIVFVFMFAMAGYFLAISATAERNGGQKKTTFSGAMQDSDHGYQPSEDDE